MRILKENVLQDYPQLKPVYDFGKRKHDATGKIRMNSGAPYWVHPDMVAEVVAAYGGTDDEIAEALLHDTREDTDTTAEELERLFGPDIAQVVEEVTNFESEVKRLGKEQYINKELLELSDSALLVKLADMYCNSLDKPKPGQAERMARNLNYLLDHADYIDDRCRRLIKSFPLMDDYDLGKSEFDTSLDDFEETPGVRLVSSRKIQRNKLSERRRRRRN